AALALGYRAARRAGSDRVVAAAAMAAVLSAFPFTGGWYDLVRNDGLLLALGMAGLYVAIAWPTARGAVASPLLLSGRYFAQQTGTALLVAGLGVVLVMRPRLATWYVVVVAVALGGLVLLVDHRTQGWFLAWVQRAHARHDFYPRRAFVETPWILIKQAPAV